jgi:hypothetical protein
MPIDFFEREVRNCQERFNQTYGGVIVCNLKLRLAAIISIIQLEHLCRKIRAAYRKHEMKDDIRTFMRVRRALNNHFNQVIKRRHYEAKSKGQ